MTPQHRGLVPGPQGRRIIEALALRAESQLQVELAVADALKAGGSVREVADFSGLSTTTVQKYGRAHGWPTKRQRQTWEERRASVDEFQARLDAAAAVLALMEQDVAEDPTPDDLN